MTEAIVGNVAGEWWIEIVDGSTIVDHMRLSPTVGLALSALNAFHADPANSPTNSRWTATNETEDT